jgi:hypothetical protein
LEVAGFKLQVCLRSQRQPETGNLKPATRKPVTSNPKQFILYLQTFYQKTGLIRGLDTE